MSDDDTGRRVSKLERAVEELDERHDVTSRNVVSLEESRRGWRWFVGITAPLLLGAALTAVITSFNAASTSSERVGSMTATVEALRDEVRLLRMKLDKLAGVDSPAITITQAP